MDMNIQKYMAFIKTVERGSFTKAAEILNYSQSGISRMIGDLEKEWKVSLLERNRTGVKLTSDGTKLLPYARNVCEEYMKLQMQVDDLNGLQSGLIRIGTISSIATHWLPNIIAEFQKKYPNINYELLLGHYADIEAWINEGRVDVGLQEFQHTPIWKWSFWNKTSCSLYFPKIILSAVVINFPLLHWRNILLCYLKREKKRKYRKSLNAVELLPTFNL